MTKVIIDSKGFEFEVVNDLNAEVPEGFLVVEPCTIKFAKPKYNFETQQWEEGATGKVLDDFNKLQEQCKQEETQFKIQQNLPYELLRALNDLQLKTLKLGKGSK